MSGGGGRWRRWKERQQRGAFVVPVEFNDQLVGQMLDRGLIAERDSRSRQKIGRAIRNYLANAFGDVDADDGQYREK